MSNNSTIKKSSRNKSNHQSSSAAPASSGTESIRKRQIALVDLILRKRKFGPNNNRLLELLNMISEDPLSFSHQNRNLLLKGSAASGSSTFTSASSNTLMALDRVFLELSRDEEDEDFSYNLPSSSSSKRTKSYSSSATTTSTSKPPTTSAHELVVLILARLSLTYPIANSSNLNNGNLHLNVPVANHIQWAFQKLSDQHASTQYQVWILRVIEAMFKDELVAAYLVKELADHEHTVQEFLLTPLLAHFNTAIASANVLVILSILDSIESKFPSCFCSHYTSIVDIFIGWCIDPSVPVPLRQSMLDRISFNYLSFWKSHFSYGVSFIKNLVFDLEQLFGLSLDPTVHLGDGIAALKKQNNVKILSHHPLEVDCIGKAINAILNGIIKSLFSLSSSTNDPEASRIELKTFKSLELAIQWYLDVLTLVSLSHFTNESWILLGTLFSFCQYC